MAPSSPRLPRMQNQSRARAPLERSLNIVSQVLEKTIKQKTSSPPPMMRQYDLIERVKRYNPATSEALLNRAYVYAMKAHGQQKRASGDLYFSHPLEVAAILTDLKLDDATIAAALLHDTSEDTAAPRAWACTRCRRSSKTSRSASSIRRLMVSSAAGSIRSRRRTSTWSAKSSGS